MPLSLMCVCVALTVSSLTAMKKINSLRLGGVETHPEDNTPRPTVADQCHGAAMRNSYIREVAQTCPGYCNQCWKPVQQMKTHRRDREITWIGTDVTNGMPFHCTLCW